MYPIMLNDYGYNEYNELIETIMEKEQIYFDKKVLLEYNNLSPYFIFNLFNKLKLLKLTNIDNISEYIYIIDNKDFDTYTTHIIQKNIKDATNILFNLFDKGMSLLDIYYFLYEYYKTINQTYKYKFIEQICKYIKYIYDGYDNKIMLLFITNDIINIYNNI
jgi:DNA polymerase III gamma/tau subunit